MAQTIDLTVPDLGGFDDVPIITVFVKPGDTIGKDAPLIELESEKATMEVPAAQAGTIRDVTVKIGDRVSQGSVIARVEVVDGAAAVAPVAAAPAPPSAAPLPTATESASASVPPPSATAAPPAANGATIELTVPDLGDFSDIPVITVFIRPGDTIAKDTPLVELESEKATMEVPALAAGTVVDVHVKAGDRVSQGSVLGTIAIAGPTKHAGSIETASPSAPAPALASVVAGQPPSKNGASNGAHADNGSAVTALPSGIAPIVHASPAIRRFARELGVPLARVTGSGPNGRITREDVQGYVKTELARGASAPAPASASGAVPANGSLSLLPWPKVDFAKFGPIERTPLSRIAKISGPNLARNWVLIPHITQNEEADVTDLESFRKSINAEQKDIKVTMLALLMKAVVATLRQYPAFNSSLDGDELVIKHYYHLGFAADTPNGLVVPVIRDVDKKGILAIALETSTLAKKARDGKLGPAEMTGGTFTISSLGGIGGTTFTPIINAPEVAILGASRNQIKPLWDGAAFVPPAIMPLSLSYDHRVIDGAAGARFVAYLAGILADFRKVLL